MKNFRLPILNRALSLHHATKGSATESMTRPKMMMIPMMVILVAVIVISLLGQTTAVGPFIYTLF